jgi:hypothetical protein
MNQIPKQKQAEKQYQRVPQKNDRKIKELEAYEISKSMNAYTSDKKLKIRKNRG